MADLMMTSSMTSRDVIDDVIIRSAIGHFLLVGNWYQASISMKGQGHDASQYL